MERITNERTRQLWELYEAAEAEAHATAAVHAAALRMATALQRNGSPPLAHVLQQHRIDKAYDAHRSAFDYAATVYDMWNDASTPRDSALYVPASLRIA